MIEQNPECQELNELLIKAGEYLLDGDSKEILYSVWTD